MALYNRTSALVDLGGDSCTLTLHPTYVVTGHTLLVDIPSLLLLAYQMAFAIIDWWTAATNWPAFLGMPKVRLSGTIIMHLMGLLPSGTSPLVFCQTHCLYGVIYIQGFSLQWSQKRRETRRHFKEYRQVFVQTAYSPEKPSNPLFNEWNSLLTKHPPHNDIGGVTQNHWWTRGLLSA